MSTASKQLTQSAFPAWRSRLAGDAMSPILFAWSDERVAGAQPREVAEVTVCSPQLGDAVIEADSGDPRVVNPRTDHPRRTKQLDKRLQVTRSLGKELHRAGRVQLLHHAQSVRGLARRIVDPRVGDDGEELVHAGPRDRPVSGRVDQALHRFARAFVMWAVSSMGINKEVRVDGDHSS